MVTSPWVVGAASCMVDLSGVSIEVWGGLRGLLSIPPPLSFLLAGLLLAPQCSRLLALALVGAGLACPCLY